MNAASAELSSATALAPPALSIEHAVSFPDRVLLVVVDHNSSSPSVSVSVPDLLCLYFPSSSSSSSSQLRLPPISSIHTPPSFLIHCPNSPSEFNISLQLSPSLHLPPILPYRWDRLSYAAVVDFRDNSTLVFAKGFNLRPARLAVASRYECVFGWDCSIPKYLLTTPAISVAQEIVRCATPLSILRRLRLRRPSPAKDPPLVSVRTKGRGAVTLPSVARPEVLSPPPIRRTIKDHSMCVCTMLRNQARFLREWIMYHAEIGVRRWFIYDNNSDDDIQQVIDVLSSSSNYNVTLHSWPWVKTQEAGFAHCALRARDHCDWLGFIDVDEFLYFPAESTLQDVLSNYSSQPSVGELRTACHSFGPSGRKSVPAEGVTVGYTCRMNAPERHKSIVRPDALNPSMINVVHHFHLKEGMRYVNMGQGVMVINHYKYQVWEVFKDKFYRRVATYVADWQDKENVGSKDRAPGLGTKAVEPPDWPSRFCEVNDTGLRDWVLRVFADRRTGLLPW